MAKRISEVMCGHIRANRCGCEVNNLQGSCSLGNVTQMINAIHKDEPISGPGQSTTTG